jgi:hypothetical protein
MRRLLAEMPDIQTSFQPFQGHEPEELLDRHPGGGLVARYALPESRATPIAPGGVINQIVTIRVIAISGLW